MGQAGNRLYDKKQIDIEECRQLQLDIFREIIAVCERHDLCYILDYGSLIGVVRHAGFIPWDDDIDISMPRPDYERLKEVFEKEQPSDSVFELRTGMKGNVALPYVQVVNRETVTVKKGRREAYAQAVWVDVFPVDGTSEVKEEREELYENYWKIIYVIRQVIGRYRPYRNPRKQLRQFYFHFIKRCWLGKIIREAERIMKTIDYESSDAVFCYPTVYGADEKNHKKYYENRMEMTFEGISCMVPKDYDEKLQGIYGDYRTLPPEEERKGHDYIAYYRKGKEKV